MRILKTSIIKFELILELFKLVCVCSDDDDDDDYDYYYSEIESKQLFFH